MAIDLGDVDTINSLADYYKDEKYEEIKKYYLMSIEKCDSGAMTNLG